MEELEQQLTAATDLPPAVDDNDSDEKATAPVTLINEKDQEIQQLQQELEQVKQQLQQAEKETAQAQQNYEEQTKAATDTSQLDLVRQKEEIEARWRDHMEKLRDKLENEKEDLMAKIADKEAAIEKLVKEMDDLRDNIKVETK